MEKPVNIKYIIRVTAKEKTQRLIEKMLAEIVIHLGNDYPEIDNIKLKARYFNIDEKSKKKKKKKSKIILPK